MSRVRVCTDPAWTPTSENINGLPEPIRDYIHALETRCDPSGLVLENAMARDLCRQLEATFLALKARIKELETT
jgi:hypothetical protein